MSQDDSNQDETVTVDRLVTGDRPSLYFVGMAAANAIRMDEMAVFMVDALGRVLLMPPSSIQVIHRPKVKEEELDQMSESVAINILLKQGESEESITSYLFQRAQRGID